MEKKEDDEEYVASNSKAEDDDEDYLYKRSRRSPQQYKKRKDVIFKTILRKSRRQLQGRFNALTNYFGERKGKGGEWLKTCLVKFASQDDYLSTRPDLNLVFNLGCFLYPQDVSKHVDQFFESEKSERVKR